MLHLLCALHCEAKPWIDHFRLQRQPQLSGFECYRNQQVWLVISGIGGLSMAAASAWLAGQQTRPALWLNVGIAGHAEAEPGQLFVLNKVSAANQQNRYYPPQLLRRGPPGQACLSIDQEQSDYPEHELLDMEAWAFQHIARRFQSAELVQALKVVSDNRLNSPTRDKAHISHLIATALPAALDAIKQWQSLLELQQQESVDALQQELQQRLHFSRTQAQQLHRLLQQNRAFGISEQTLRPLLQPFQQAKPLLQALQQQLQAQQ